MPAYPIPNWLHGPPDPAHILLQSHQIGAHIAMERARLEQQSQLEQIKLDLEQEREDRQSRQKQQELEIEKSYHDQLSGLRQKQLEEAQQKIDLQAKVAGQKYAAQQNIQRRIAAGEDPNRVYLEEGAAAGGTLAGLSGFSRNLTEASRMAQTPEIETAYTDQGETPFIRNAKTGAIHFVPRANMPKDPSASQLSTLLNQQSGINPKTPGFNPSMTSNIVQTAQNKLLRSLQGKSAEIGNEPVGQPWPTKKSDLKKGETYLHPWAGSVTWDGEKAVPIKPPSMDQSPEHTENEELPVATDQE